MCSIVLADTREPAIPVERLWDHFVALSKNTFKPGMKRKPTLQISALTFKKKDDQETLCDDLKKMKLLDDDSTSDDLPAFPLPQTQPSPSLAHGNGETVPSQNLSLLDSLLQEPGVSRSSMLPRCYLAPDFVSDL